MDAPDKETNKRVGRPLFRDAWDRFQECLDILRERPGRRVLRLTLVRAPGAPGRVQEW